MTSFSYCLHIFGGAISIAHNENHISNATQVAPPKYLQCDVIARGEASWQSNMSSNGAKSSAFESLCSVGFVADSVFFKQRLARIQE